MKKMTMFAAALAAVGVTLFSSTVVRAQPAPQEVAAAARVDQVAMDRAVERHLGALLHRKLADLREERAWALGLR